MAKSFDDLVKRTTTKRTRAKAARRTQELLGELLLRELRQVAGKSQRQLAEALGIKQPSLSKLEKQSDMQISTRERSSRHSAANWRCWPGSRKGPSGSTSSTPRLGGGGAGLRDCSWCDHGRLASRFGLQ